MSVQVDVTTNDDLNGEHSPSPHIRSFQNTLFVNKKRKDIGNSVLSLENRRRQRSLLAKKTEHLEIMCDPLQTLQTSFSEEGFFKA